MARTRLTSLLRGIHAAYREAERTGLPADEIFAAAAARRLSRGAFLCQAASAAFSAVAATPLRAFAKDAPRVVIVGGGLAGVTCAYRLMQSGIPSRIYDAAGGVGGRTWTLRNFFDEGQTAEHGGEFISSEHLAIRKLALELGLVLDDLRGWDKREHGGAEDIYYVHGSKYTVSQMLRDYAAVYPKLRAAADASAFPVRYDRHTAAAYKYDHMTARQWIEANVPGGISSRIGWLLDLDATTENGGDSTQQNALTLIDMLGYMPGYNPHGGFYLVGTDERYRVHGGNDQIVGRMAAKLPPASIHPNTHLVALRRRADGSYLVTLSAQLQTIDVPADHVVLALPFVTLKETDLSKAGFTAVKMRAINGLPMGTNTKLHVQFKQRAWYQMGYNGYTYADTGFQQTWEDTRGQSGTAGVLVDYTGGLVGASWDAPSFAPAAPAFVQRFVSQLQPVYPGMDKLLNGKAYLDNWTKDRWHKGSYSYWGVGNCTSFGGVEGAQDGNVHFCGEHTSVEFLGFMNGAVATGESAAHEIVRDVKGAAAAALGSLHAV